LSSKLHEKQIQWALGKQLAAEVEQHVELITGEFLLDYVNRLERNIVSGSGLSGCFVVKVIRDPEPNAYSLPGGFIYLTTGLIDLVETEGQLVGALAHETAHITGRHLTQIDRQARVWGSLALAAGPAGYGLRRLLGPLLLMKLLRDKELEADRLGIQYHIASGYEPMDFCTFLQIAFPDDDDKQHQLGFFRHFSDTHPSTRERIEHLHAAISTYRLTKTAGLVAPMEFGEMKMRFAIMMAARQNP
jgi:predicted Zn-dependent protease